MAVAKAAGAMRIVAVDINSQRLQFAKSYAATDIFLPPAKETGDTAMLQSKKTIAMMREQLGISASGSLGIDVALDVTGAESCIQSALLALKPGGRFVQVNAFLIISEGANFISQVGFGRNNVNVPIGSLLVKEIKVRGSFRYGVRI